MTVSSISISPTRLRAEHIPDVILSLVRTTRVGYLRDIRRLTVALSRARLGLYIVGRKDVFASCYELHEAFDRLFQRPTNLMLVTGEMFPSKRKLVDETSGTEMVGVEHFGQYVYEMSQAKLEQIGVGGGENIIVPELVSEVVRVEEEPMGSEEPGFEAEEGQDGERSPQSMDG